MNQIFILFRDSEFNHGVRDLVGWFSNEAAAIRVAHEMEWNDFREESATPSQGSTRLSPDQAEYRRYTIEPAHQLG